MSTREKVLKFAKNKKDFATADIVEFLGVSRQAASRLLSQLVKEGHLQKSGSTKMARYRLSSKKGTLSQKRHFKLRRKLDGLEEDRVFEEISLRMGLKSFMGERAYSILYYAFTEMLNNAIDHSKSESCLVQMTVDDENISFEIRDFGIGAFENIRQNFELENSFHAVEHLLKGKQTTFPEAHSGQGIFFTSKIADQFSLRSEKIQLQINNVNDDLSVADCRKLEGTLVSFNIKKNTRKDLEKLFRKYANDDFDFDRTKIVVKLTAAREHLSRSQAKRLILGLEKFDLIIFDFSGVKSVGQAFIDEIFRVFSQRHPKIELQAINMNPSVTFMVKRGRV